MEMHENQLDLGTGTATRLIRELLPGTAEAHLREVETSATTSRIVRIGDDLTARFPLVRADAAAARERLETEHTAMAEFAGLCPVPAPEPVAIGEPSPAFPMPFSVQTWVPGTVAGPGTVADSEPFARDLGTLLGALRGAPTRGRRFAGAGRGGDLPDHEDWIQECLARSRNLLPVPELAARWSRWRELERCGPDVMSHGDLIPANLLTEGGRLTGVLDTGGFAAADPALDLVAAWHLLDRPRREVLRSCLGSTELEWERGAAWAFAQAIGLVWYYEVTNPPMAALGRSTLERLLEDPSVGAPR